MRFLFIPLVAIFMLGGCTSAAKKQQKALAVAVYSAQKAIDNKRVDLAKNYIKEASRLLPPPKKLPKIAPAKSDNGQITYTILPEGYIKENILVLDSPEYRKVMEENISLKKQITLEAKETEKFATEVDNAIRSVHEEAIKEKKKSWFGWVFASISGLGFIGMIVLAIFFPALLPVVINIIKLIGAWISNVFKSIVESIRR